MRIRAVRVGAASVQPIAPVRIGAAAVSPDGERVALPGRGVWVVDALSGRLVETLSLDVACTAAAWSADGRDLVAVCDDGDTVVVWRDGVPAARRSGMGLAEGAPAWVPGLGSWWVPSQDAAGDVPAPAPTGVLVRPDASWTAVHVPYPRPHDTELRWAPDGRSVVLLADEFDGTSGCIPHSGPPVAAHRASYGPEGLGEPMPLDVDVDVDRRHLDVAPSFTTASRSSGETSSWCGEGERTRSWRYRRSGGSATTRGGSAPAASPRTGSPGVP